MNIIVLQHIRMEDPGYLGDLMRRDNWRMDTVELDEGEPIPDNLDVYDGMVCMGGPMDTWMEEAHPWLVDEKRRIHEFVVEKQKPFLGVCLGCQLLGEVVGGKVIRSAPPEIGVLDVNVDARARGGEDALFGGLPGRIKALQWHSYEVVGLEDNPHVTPLASSPTTPWQAFRWQKHAYGVQFHMEIRSDTVRSWADVPEYKDALEAALGDGALERVDAQAAAHMAHMNRCSELLYTGFNQLVRAAHDNGNGNRDNNRK